MKMKAHQFILALSVSFFSHSILSQSKVVVIPLFGDDTSAQWRGGWAVDTMYEQSDIVEFDGSSYFALIGHTATLANIPPSDAEWDLVAAAGANGATGDQGNQGIQGERGEKGEQGLPGVQGPQGDKGDQGLPGVQGPQGDKGDQGLPGVQGPQGSKGDQGVPGVQGPQGDKGDQGVPGVQGVQGPQGVKGDQGELGIAPSNLFSWYGDVASSSSPENTPILVVPEGSTFLLTQVIGNMPTSDRFHVYEDSLEKIQVSGDSGYEFLRGIPFSSNTTVSLKRVNSSQLNTRPLIVIGYFVDDSQPTQAFSWAGTVTRSGTPSASTVISVPAGKAFVLYQVLGSSRNDDLVTWYGNSTVRFITSTLNLTINDGIVFSSGDVVSVTIKNNSVGGVLPVMVLGSIIDLPEP